MPLPPPKTRHLSLTRGLTIGTIGTIIGFAVLLIPPYINNPLLSLVIFLGSFGLLAYFSHCLAHYIIGRIIGMKFSHYVLGSSPQALTTSPTIKLLDSLLPRLGIRLTSQSRKNATHTRRIIMLSSGVVTSTLLPLVPTVISYGTLPMPLAVILPLLWMAYVIFGAYFSPRYGDLSRITARPPS